MSEGEIQEKSTLEIAQEYIACIRTRHKLCHVPWWRFFRLLSRKWRLRRCMQRGRALEAELMIRFDGILFQVASRLRNTEPRSQPWIRLKDALLGVRDSRRFSPCFWSAALWGTRRTDPRVLALKPKFMLRQFVDEMSQSEERGALRILAYGEAPGPKSRESVRLLGSAFGQLHQRVLDYVLHLDVMTDRSIPPSVVRTLQDASQQYWNWLFSS